MEELIEGCSDVTSLESFYEEGAKYWKTIPADINGMLGGFSHISNTDIQGSKSFLRPFLKGSTPTNTQHALDCGAGIGRISKGLLLPIFNKVDLLELNENFINNAREYIGPKLNHKVGKLICCGMQEAELQENYYDIIWVQWVTGHLVDQHLITFLKNCKKALKPNGLIVIKENITKCGIELDETDSSVARSEDALKSICKNANLNIIKEEFQKNFPACLYSVIILALR